MQSNPELGLQKVCDIHDFFHPEIDHILRKELKSVPFGSRRAWEFAMIYRALEKKGKLHEQADGLGLGAGTERLIYALVPRARKTVVTDLYTDAGGWEGVRTKDPLKLVMSKAPWPIAPERLDVRSMDMRHIKFPDESFDFCWSTGAIEHIGHDEDFLRHFAEVHRVLRPGGVYAFTTAVVFGGDTLRIPHNYYFNPNHLVDLIHQSPLHAEPEFDCRITDHILNRPHIERFQDYGFTCGNQLSKPIVSFRRGVLLAANVMVLTKDPGRPKERAQVVGYGAACRQLRRHADKITAQIWKEPQLLRAEQQGRRLVIQPQYFGQGAVALDVLLPAGAPSMVHVSVNSRGVDELNGWHLDCDTEITRASTAPITFAAAEGRIYRIAVEKVSPEESSRVVIRARKLSGVDEPTSVSKGPMKRALLRDLRVRFDLLKRALT